MFSIREKYNSVKLNKKQHIQQSPILEPARKLYEDEYWRTLTVNSDNIELQNDLWIRSAKPEISDSPQSKAIKKTNQRSQYLKNKPK